MKALPYLCSLSLMFSVITISFSQTYRIPDGGDGGPHIQATPCLDESNHHETHLKLQSLTADYLRRHPNRLRSLEDTTFSWPIRQSDDFAYDYVYGISNFVDQNPAFPGQVTDFNCTSRSYDTQGGYNHPGTDIFVYPFPWRAVKYDQVEVVAPASGVILSVQDGNRDTNCDFNDNSAVWNAIYLMHDNGFTTWFGHLKAGTFTEKRAGDRVERGEFLGIMASSGRSSGPHLHFEVYDDEGQLIDPYAGPCNTLNTQSYWDEQKPFREPRINALITHSARPRFAGCVPESGEEETMVKSCFVPGESIITTAYYHDQQRGDTTFFRLINPSGDAFDSWFHVSPNTYNASWWFWTYNAPQNAMPGRYTWEAKFGDQVARTTFYIGETEKNITDTTQYCEGSKASLSVPDIADAQYFWSNGMRTANVDIGHSGEYTVSITDATSCTEVTFPVTEKAAPMVDFPTRVEFCTGESVDISAPDGFDAYQWSTGETSQQITVMDEGRYILDLTEGNCTYSYSVDAFLRKIRTPELILGPTQVKTSDTTWYRIEALRDHQYAWSANGGQVLSPGTGDSIRVVWETGGSVGELCVMTTGPDGCLSSRQTCLRVEIDPLTSTRYIPGISRYRVFPNPAGDQVQISLSAKALGSLRVKLISSLGQEVKSWHWNVTSGHQERSLDLSEIPDGWYLLTLETQAGVLSRKLVHRRL